MIDLHAHILPGLDDGPDDLEASVALARAAATAGTATLVATPHIRGDYPFDPARIHPAVEELNARLVEEGVSLDVVPGGEVSITSLLEIDDPTLDVTEVRRRGFHPPPLSPGVHDAYRSVARSQRPHSVTPFSGSSLPPLCTGRTW